MSYQAVSLPDLLTELNKANSTTFTLNDIQFATPQVVAGTWKDKTTLKNTGVVVTAKAGSAFQGRANILYDRLPLSALDPAKLKGFQCAAYQPAKIYDLLSWLKYWNGIQLTTDDIVDGDLVDNGNGTKTAVLSAKPTSYGWQGSVSIIVTAGGASLNNVLTVPDLQGLNYPTASDADTYSQIYMYGYDFTNYFADIVAMNVGVLSGANVTKLVNAFKAVDVSSGKALWNEDSGSTTWSLAGATVVSNGLNSPSLPTNPAYKYVMALSLRAGVSIPAGTLYLHYNDPFDPNA